MRIAVIGGGLAGCECAFALARLGLPVTLFEMKPARFSPAHKSPALAELVCSNSLRSDDPLTAIGLLKEEMTSLGSLIMDAARATNVPAGMALAVDRDLFAARVTQRIENAPDIALERREIASLTDPALAGFTDVVVAAGPLASDGLAASLARAVGSESLYFYDAIAPIVSAESVEMDKVFFGSRNQPGQDDYLNCPMDREEYFAFIRELLEARKVPAREFEEQVHFEGCLPIETMAERGEMTLAFGPLKPVGLIDPKTGRRPFANVQLRAENREKTLFNLVGFQTKLAYPEQERVFRLIPGLSRAKFVRRGSIHRNTFVDAPRVLSASLELLARPNVFLAGQITGVEGYLESAACGLYAGLCLGLRVRGRTVTPPPRETALGGLLGHLREPAKNFQPSNANFGLTPPLEARAGKAKRRELY
ncbi:MAG: methylenetetrahydrofolate--tRNA-(uracil(54)-C(5))-methyltransferase (FADH(2)-oxidizing) TrmFO, partial [Desulfovibrionaceae bacterium]|nr:methylenetetrahydrofolate--tRNA-(uracil(54)-C(5))-methyltransferase (FADH(2)-oxidizing) TrmFO [Desulfovibrionaceae bacterium]